MRRQRLRARGSALSIAGRLLALLLGLALLWYGAMVVLLAAKVAPQTVNDLSGYRSAYDFLASLGTGDVSDATRAVAAGAGLLAMLVFGFLAWKELPRPYLALSELELSSDDRGRVTIAPRAVERIAEAAACDSPAVSAARARETGSAIEVDVTVGQHADIEATLAAAQRRAIDALERHSVPNGRVDVILTRFDSTDEKEHQ
jgi:hypothetical protein